MPLNKKPLLIGNWKLNHSKASAADFFDRVISALPKTLSLEIAIAPVALHLDFAAERLKNSALKVVAQNVSCEEKGAFTGEFSAWQLKELGVEMAIVGHSERRIIFKESDEMVAKKALACLKAGIAPIICVGETLLERDQGQLLSVLTRQCNAVMKEIGDLSSELIFAYEPVWAIGTGRSASAQEANEAHQIIKNCVPRTTKILYGGSVSAQNSRELVSMPFIDGALVGGASLQVDSFLSMVNELSLGV